MGSHSFQLNKIVSKIKEHVHKIADLEMKVERISQLQMLEGLDDEKVQKHLRTPKPIKNHSGMVDVPQGRSSSVMTFSAYATTPQPAHASIKSSPSKRHMKNNLELAPSTLLPLNKDEVILNMPIIKHKHSLSNFNFTMTNPKFDRIK